MEALRKAFHFLRRHRRAVGIVAGASAAALAVWRVKRVLDEYKRLIKEHDLARIDHHRCVCLMGWAGLGPTGPWRPASRGVPNESALPAAGMHPPSPPAPTHPSI